MHIVVLIALFLWSFGVGRSRFRSCKDLSSTSLPMVWATLNPDVLSHDHLVKALKL